MDRRVAALAALDAVVPSQFGDARFCRLAPGYSPSSVPAGFTTCGYLPQYLLTQLGMRGDKLAAGGVEGVRMRARELGIWVEPGAGQCPRLGDVLGLAAAPGGILVHVAAVKSASGSTWITADAGQGPRDAQRAEYVSRTWDGSRVSGPAGPRYVAGWVDLDRVPGLSFPPAPAESGGGWLLLGALGLAAAGGIYLLTRK